MFLLFKTDILQYKLGAKGSSVSTERAMNCESFELDSFNKLLVIPRWSSLAIPFLFFLGDFFIDSVKLISFSALAGQHKKH